MKRFLVFLLSSICMVACIGGSDNQARDNPSDHLIDPVAKGNGMFNYSVATDYFYGQNNQAPSLKYDLSQFTTTAIQYTFPVFGYLRVDNNTLVFTDPSSYSIDCAPSSPVVFNYYAMPQISGDVVAGVESYLGNCVNGESTTSYYAGFLGHVVPVVEYADAFVMAFGESTTTPQMVRQIADTVAQVINSDRNAYGVAFDNESALNSVSPTYELQFFGEIALKLAESKKYLFLFDANATGISLYKNGYNGKSLNNIVLLQPLYDLETVNDESPSGPVSVATYTTDATHYVNSYLADPASPPLMFVIPASSTSTIWTSLEGYDMVPSNKAYINPTSLDNPTTCESADAMESGTIDNGVLSLFLCVDDVCTPTNPTIIIANFLNSQNCVQYTNSESLPVYFSTVLNIIESNTNANDPRYMGSALYAWRITAYNDIACGVHYYSVYGDDTLYKLCTQQFPPEIIAPVWESFNTWHWPN